MGKTARNNSFQWDDEYLDEDTTETYESDKKFKRKDISRKERRNLRQDKFSDFDDDDN